MKRPSVCALALALTLIATRASAAERDDQRLVHAGFGLIAVGVAGFGAAVGTAFARRAAERRFEELRDQRGPLGFSTTTWAEAKHELDRRPALARATTILAPIGAASAVVGAVLLATGMTRKQSAVITPVAWRHGAGLEARVRF